MTLTTTPAAMPTPTPTSTPTSTPDSFHATLSLVQDAYAAFGRGDVPAMLAMMSPDVRWQFVADRAAPFTATVHGTSQVAEWFASVVQADDLREFEPLRFLAGPGHVTVIGRERTIARATGREFRCEWVHVWTVVDGRITDFYGILDSEVAGDARRA